MNQVSELIELLDLERIEVNLFRGNSKTIGSGRVFGGQVMAQALSAAMKTVETDRFVHSLHGYFLLPGDESVPIIFEVERARDGGSFTTRRVKAIQHGQIILNMAASFQRQQEGYSHQITMPNVQAAESLASWDGMVKKYGDDLPPKIKRFLDVERPLEFRPVEFINPLMNKAHAPQRNVWMKAKGAMPDDPRIHQLVLAYASDYNLLTTALLPHGIIPDFRSLTLASLDHATWFHRPFRMDEWLLYSVDSPSASGARGFTRGSIFNQQGELVASVAQEGLMRPRKEK